MPKQVYKINRFDGGINNDSNPRDIQDNEVVSIKNGSVDTLGSIKALQYGQTTLNTYSGGSITSSSGDRATIEENKIPYGKGLFLFSSDYTGGEILTKGTHTATAGSTLTDSNNRFVNDVLNGATVWNTTQDEFATITDTSDSGSAGLVTGTLTNSATYAQNDEYHIYNLNNASSPGQSTGDTYLCISKKDTNTGGVYVKSLNNGNAAQAVIKFLVNTNIEPSFYSADGILRVSDSSFSSTINNNRWYGYVERTLFTGTNFERTINTWVSEDSEPKKLTSYNFALGTAISSAPSSKTFGDNIAVTGTNNDTSYTSNSNNVSTSSGDTNTEKSQANLSASSGMGGDYVSRVSVRIVTTGASLGSTWSINGVFRIGQKSSDAFQSTGYQYQTFTLSNTKLGDGENESVTQANLSFNWGATDFPINVNNAKYSLRQLSVSGSGYGTLTIDSITFHGGGTGDEVFSSLANSIGIAVGDSATSSDDWAGDWNVGATFIYDGNQESLVQQLLAGTEDVVTLTKAPYTNVSVKYTRNWNHRITGINIYMKKESDSEWLLHGTVDLINSTIQRPLDSVKQSSAYNSANSAHLYQLTGEISKDVPIITYESNSGISQESPSLTAEFKTAVIANRRAYIGNVKMKDVVGKKRVFADRIVKSPVNQFDTFPLQNVVDAVINDGESITALEVFGDKLLQYKERTLYILNIAGRYEVLESSHDFRGVEAKEAVCMTEFGVAWCNKYGVFFYDGRQISSLLEKNGVRLISESEWTSFYTEHGTEEGSIITYVPKKRQLIIVSSYGDTTDSGNSYIFDFVTRSWSFADNLFGTDSTEISNIVNLWDGELVYLENSSSNVKLQKKTISSTESSLFELITKEIDFGNPASKKNIYKLIVSYKGGTNQNITPYYGVDGATPSSAFNAGTLNVIVNSNQNVLTITPTSIISNAKSFQLKLTGTSASTFELNDVSIVFREKRVV